MNVNIWRSIERAINNPNEMNRMLREFMFSLGLTPTEQYTEVLKHLILRHDHPTIDDIYRDLVGTLVLSRSRLYSILEILTKYRAIRTIYVDKDTLYYDGDTSQHGHFICTCCGEMVDMPMCEDVKLVSPLGGVITGVTMVCKGECKQCWNSYAS